MLFRTQYQLAHSSKRKLFESEQNTSFCRNKIQPYFTKHAIKITISSYERIKYGIEKDTITCEDFSCLCTNAVAHIMEFIIPLLYLSQPQISINMDIFNYHFVKRREIQGSIKKTNQIIVDDVLKEWLTYDFIAYQEMIEFKNNLSDILTEKTKRELCEYPGEYIRLISPFIWKNWNDYILLSASRIYTLFS